MEKKAERPTSGTEGIYTFSGIDRLVIRIELFPPIDIAYWLSLSLFLSLSLSFFPSFVSLFDSFHSLATRDHNC